MRTNSLLTPCKQGAVLSRYSDSLGTFTLLHASNGKKCGTKNKYLLTLSRSTSPKKPSTLRRKNPQTPRKKFLSNVKKFISEVKFPFLGPKKEEKTRLFRALSSSLVQRYNIFRRNPNCINISQQSTDCSFAAICSRRGLACVILREAHQSVVKAPPLFSLTHPAQTPPKPLENKKAGALPAPYYIILYICR